MVTTVSNISRGQTLVGQVTMKKKKKKMMMMKISH